MNLRQKYKREKKRNEELKRIVDCTRTNPIIVKDSPFDVVTLRAVEFFDYSVYLPPIDYIENSLCKKLMEELKLHITVSPYHSKYQRIFEHLYQ